MSATPKRLLREVSALLEAEGSALLGIEYGAHQKLTIRTPHGPRLLVVSFSPSDKRVLGNIRKDVRRLMREGRS